MDIPDHKEGMEFPRGGDAFRDAEGNARPTEETAELLGWHSGTTRMKIQDTAGKDVSPTHDTEHLASVEKAKVDNCVREAVERGIVVEEVFPATNNAENARDGYILSSAHFESNRRERNLKSNYIFHSQVQLAQFLHLLQRSRATSPVYCEGLFRSKPIDKQLQPTIVNCNEIAQDITEPEIQKWLFDNPEIWADFMRQCVTMSPSGVICFFDHAEYPYLEGAYVDESMAANDLITSKVQPGVNRFETLFAKPLVESGNGTMLIGTNQQKQRMVQIANMWFAANFVASECETYLNVLNEWAEWCDALETHMARLFVETPSEKTPIGFCGAQHAHFITKHLQPNMNVHVVTPVASTQIKLDYLPIGHPESNKHYSKTAHTILAFARKAMAYGDTH